MRRWSGAVFDPRAFDVNSVNVRLRGEPGRTSGAVDCAKRLKAELSLQERTEKGWTVACGFS